MAADNLAEALFAASGIAAFAIAASTLARLEQTGILTAQDVVGVIEDALAGLDKVHAATPHVELHVARDLMETCLSEWRAKL